MMHTFYNRFIRPTSVNPDQAAREVVLNYLLLGILALSVIAFSITLVDPLITGEPGHPARLTGNFITILGIAGLYGLARYRGQHTPVAVFLTLLIGGFGCFVLLTWGLQNMHGVLLLSLSVVMAGVLIGARYSLYATCALAVVLAYMQNGQASGSLHPDLSWLTAKIAPGDAVGIATILFVIALVSWLFNRQMEMSLRRAQRSEEALQRQAELLEIKVEKRARELEAAQLEKMQEIYRFAELGRLSTALFHDLANHLASVSLGIEGLSAKSQSSLMRRISEDIRHIDTIVQKVGRQIRGQNNVEVFNVFDEINEVLKILLPMAEQARVEVTFQPDKSVKQSLLYKGDIIRFRQIILNLVCNAIEAYPSLSKRPEDRIVMVALRREGTIINISVTDQGPGISRGEREKIFRPFYSTKEKGAGIGLFLVQQIAENDFKGTLRLVSGKQGTTFTVSLPKSYYAKTGRS